MLVLTLGLVIAVYVLTSAQEQRRIALEFGREAAVLKNALDRRLVRYMEAVQSLQQYASSSRKISREEARSRHSDDSRFSGVKEHV